MRDENKTKKQLISELTELRQQVAKLEEAGILDPRTKAKMPENDNYFKSLLSYLPHDIMVIAPDYRITDTNKAFLGAAGRRREEIIGRHCYEISHGYNKPCKQHGEECMLLEVFGTGKPGTCRHQHIDADGSEFWVELLLSPLKDDEGNVTHVIQSLRKVTNQVAAEEALRKSEERHRRFLQASPDPIVVYDMEGKAAYVNPAFVQTFGWSSEELLGERINFVPEENWPETRIAIARMLRGEKIQSFETKRFTKAGEILDIQLSSSLFRDSEGKPAGNIVILRDVTIQKQAKEALKRRETDLEIRTNELEEVNSALRVLLKRRDEDKAELEEKVLANVKELVLPYVERLMQSGLDARQTAYAKVLESNLQDIVSPFVQRLTSIYLGLTPTEIDVANLVKEARDTKTIAELLNLSPRTVESHRQNIRKKLGLKNKKANLRSHLLSIQ